MARLWPAGGGAPPKVDISKELFGELEGCLGITFNQNQRTALIDLCNEYLDWEDLQDAAEGSPAVAKAWLQRVYDCGIKLQRALVTGQDHSKRVGATHLRVDMHMKFDLVQRGLNDLTYAAQRVLQQNKLHITNDDRGPNENEAFSSFARRLAKLIQIAGGPTKISGGDGRRAISPFVRSVSLLIAAFPKRKASKHSRRSRTNSDAALAKRLERILRSSPAGQDRLRQA